MTLHQSIPIPTQLQLQLHALRGDAPACLTELGFEPISPEQFPSRYQFGAKLMLSLSTPTLPSIKAKECK
jgi:hypothetical protein